MRPLSYYAVFADGRVTEIVEGAATARKISPHRAYRRFDSRVEAEEFAAWWNHEHALRREAIAPRTPAVDAVPALSATPRPQGRAAKALEERIAELEATVALLNRLRA